MTEPGIGRILAASLHQGIADLLPTRLEFYENWLDPDRLRHGRIGLAPFNAVLSFLRQEGPAYHAVLRRAGAYAAEWTVSAHRPTVRAVSGALPRWVRIRAALGTARRTIGRCHVGSRASVRISAARATVDVRGSVFCSVRDGAAEPLCQFYAAAVERFFQIYGVAGEVRMGACRAVGDPSCRVDVALHSGRPAIAAARLDAE